MMKDVAFYGFTIWFSGLVFMATSVPPGPVKQDEGPQYGMTEEQTKIRVAYLRANETPYKRDTPQPGEIGYGQPIINVEAPQGGQMPDFSKPILVTPVYSCVQWDWANPDGELVYQYHPCGSRRNYWRNSTEGFPQ